MSSAPPKKQFSKRHFQLRHDVRGSLVAANLDAQCLADLDVGLAVPLVIVKAAIVLHPEQVHSLYSLEHAVLLPVPLPVA